MRKPTSPPGPGQQQLFRCESELVSYIRHAVFMTRRWTKANEANTVQHANLSAGWESEVQRYSIVWHDVPERPDSLVPESGEDSSDEDSSL